MSSTVGNSGFFFETRGKQDWLFPLGRDIKCFVIYPEASVVKRKKKAFISISCRHCKCAFEELYFRSLFASPVFRFLTSIKWKKCCFYARFLRTSEELAQIDSNHYEVHRKFMSLLLCLFFSLSVCLPKNQTNKKQEIKIKNKNKTKGTQIDKYLELVWVNARYR